MPPSVILLCLLAAAHSSRAAVIPDREYLAYDVTRTSGLSLGETTFRAEATAEGWAFEMTLQVSLPTLEIQEEYRAKADVSLCSMEFSKNASRSEQKTQERVEFDPQAREAVGNTVQGRESKLPLSSCARDGLTFLYFLREQLAAGRIPPPDSIYFGTQYQIGVKYLETGDIEVDGELRPSDRIQVDLSGPKSQLDFEIFFGKDEARTPLLIRIPLETGAFWLRLAP